MPGGEDLAVSQKHQEMKQRYFLFQRKGRNLRWTTDFTSKGSIPVRIRRSDDGYNTALDLAGLNGYVDVDKRAPVGRRPVG